MLDAQDFELPLEKKLRLKVINDEILQTKDIDTLQNSLIHTTRLLVTYQHLINSMLKKQLASESNNLLMQMNISEAGIISLGDVDSKE